MMMLEVPLLPASMRVERPLSALGASSKSKDYAIHVYGGSLPRLYFRLFFS